MVDERPVVVLLRVAGGHWLRIEVIGIYEVDVLRTNVHRDGDELPGGDDPIQLGEGIERLAPGFVKGKRQRANGYTLKIILQGGDDEETILDQRTSAHKARALVPYAAHVKTADAEIGERVV